MTTSLPQSAGSLPGPAVRPGRFRWIMIGAVSLAMVVSFFDRAAIPILIVDPGFLETFGIAGDPTAQGFIVTGYLLTYGFANILLGPVADYLGARRASLAMFFFGALASLASVLTSSIAVFTVARMARGTTDAPQFPVMNRFVRNWFPPRERGLANATWLTALAFSSAIALPLFTWIVANFGWQAAILFIVAITLGVAVPLIAVFAQDKPEQSRFTGEAERALIEGPPRPAPATPAVPVSRRAGFWADAKVFLTNPDFWLLNMFHVATLAIYWGLLTWVPKYLAEARGLSLAEMGAVTAFAFGVAAAATLGMGFVSDRLARRAPLCLAMMLLCALGIYVTATTDTALVAALALAVGLGARAVASPNLFAILQRIVPARVISTGAGLDNGISNLGSALAPTLIGLAIALTGMYAAGLFFLAGCALVAALAMAILTVRGY